MGWSDGWVSGVPDSGGCTAEVGGGLAWEARWLYWRIGSNVRVHLLRSPPCSLRDSDTGEWMMNVMKAGATAAHRIVAVSNQ